jgi:hypothetical protein
MVREIEISMCIRGNGDRAIETGNTRIAILETRSSGAAREGCPFVVLRQSRLDCGGWKEDAGNQAGGPATAGVHAKMPIPALARQWRRGGLLHDLNFKPFRAGHPLRAARRWKTAARE